MQTVSLRLSDPLAERLSDIARRKKTSKSSIVRQALESFLQPMSGVPAGNRSLADRAADLLGSLEGPGDLSLNPEYLDDLGT